MQCLTANKMENFNKILKACNSYSRFSEVTQKDKCPTIGNQTDNHVTVKVYVCANIKHTKSLCSRCPPCARMQAQRRGRHCLTASRKWKLEMFPLFNQARLQPRYIVIEYRLNWLALLVGLAARMHCTKYASCASGTTILSLQVGHGMF